MSCFHRSREIVKVKLIDTPVVLIVSDEPLYATPKLLMVPWAAAIPTLPNT